jgi:hypothetical protein
MQTVVALIIVAGAAFFLVRRICNSLKKGGPPACDCGCSGCEVSNSCEEPNARKTCEKTIV